MNIDKRSAKKEERKQYIFALRQMVSREIKRKYARSHLGIVWSVLSPLLNMAVMSLIFTKIFSRSIENFPIYYLTGNILWSLFSSSTNSSMSALVDNKSLLIKVKLPKQTFILSKLLTSLTNFGYSCIPYVLMLMVFQIKPSLTMLLLPIPVFFLALFSAGIGFLLSILYVFFADIKYLYSVLMTLWMYMSAIFYPVESVAPAMQKIISINPVHSCISFARQCVMEGTCPEPMAWIKMILWGVATFAVGYFVFKKKENDVMQKV